ncbi:MAG: MBL fold metallo-hydrolase [Actinomycetota bacterium]
MRARIWGTRGSLATPGPDTVRYGGNTSCIEIRPSDGSLLILDSGTGIRGLGAALDGSAPKRIDILLSHLHLDHLEGLGFFAPLWDPSTELHIWGPASPVRSLSDRIAQYLSPPLFPVRLAEVPARVRLHDAPEEPWQVGSATVRAGSIIHRGPTVGYRIEEAGQTIAYLTDHEPARAHDLTTMPVEWISGFELAAGADVLIHDCQYTEEEYPDRAGFGHSSTEHVADFARLASPRQLLLFHHDPNHDDDELETLCARVRELWSDGAVDLAREGQEIAFG